jgi:hypothetical protein
MPHRPVLGRWASIAVLLLVTSAAFGVAGNWRRATAPTVVTVEIAGERLRIPVGYIPNPRRRADGPADGIVLEMQLPDLTPPGPFQPGQDTLLVTVVPRRDDAEAMLSRLQTAGHWDTRAIERKRDGVQPLRVDAAWGLEREYHVLVKHGCVALLISCSTGTPDPRCGAAGSHWRSLSLNFSFKTIHLYDVAKIQDRLRYFLDSLA